ncbi:hypothetical protein [Streptomyces sp. Ag109_O5-10]|uniref:hypothetical protein n=1 Tax=Streptomyces sp. Ag109_O5-10 TaxID=1855349 RepID=UPI000895E9A4|nr:hypothetical protein [Streptomyces sp. Ag109_O5-10]SEF17028.1 hypothetical protein SAMN05216533_8113 [Streptomyces sp. Ag109_O5-10]
MSGLPAVERVDSAVHTVPTDSPEADGTAAWDSTTRVLVTVRCGDVTGLGNTHAPAAWTVSDLLARTVTEQGRPFRIS